MQCMEIWGGNQAVSSEVELAGLNAWVVSHPYSASGGGAGAAGGDIHYVTSCATGRISRIVIADVSGHGETVARAADALRRLMRAYSNYVDQSSFVENLNKRFAELAEAADDATVQPGAFATAVVATYFAPTDELAISNAGHPRPMLYRARERRWSPIIAASSESGLSNLPLGVDTPTAYPTTQLSLNEGDMVLFYTDSLIEAKDSAGRMLGERGLLERLSELAIDEPGGFISRVIQSISPDGPGKMNDDVTVMLFSRNGKKPTPSVFLGLQAGARIAMSVLDSLRPGSLPASLPQFDLRSIGGAMVQRLNRIGSAQRTRNQP